MSQEEFDFDFDSAIPSDEFLFQLQDAEERGRIAYISQIRTATVILTTFNIISALTLAGKIMYFARRDRKIKPREGLEKEVQVDEKGDFMRDDGGLKKPWWKQLHVPAGETFPFALGIAIAIQGMIFLAAESKAIDGRKIVGSCSCLSEATWAAIWITPYLSLVFTGECLSRAFANPSFAPRTRFSTIMCVLMTAFMVMVTWIPARTWKTPMEDICDGQLMSFINQFSAGGLALSAVLIPTWVFMAVAIWMSLGKGLKISVEERIGAIKIVVYCILTILQWAFVVPFFTTSSAKAISKPVAFMSTIVLNMSGILSSIAHHYLHHYSTRLLYLSPINPKCEKEASRQILSTPGSPMSEKNPAGFYFNTRSPGITEPPPTYAHTPDRRQSMWPGMSLKSREGNDYAASVSRSKKGLTWASRRTGRWKDEVLAIINDFKLHGINGSGNQPTDISTISSPTPNNLPAPNNNSFSNLSSLPIMDNATLTRAESVRSSTSTKDKRKATYSMFPPPTFPPQSLAPPQSPPPPLPAKPRSPPAVPLPSILEPSNQPPPARPSRERTPSVNMRRKQDVTSCTGTVSIGMILTPDEIGSPTLGCPNKDPHHLRVEPLRKLSNGGAVGGYKFPPPPMERAEPPQWASDPEQKNGIRRGSEASVLSFYPDSSFV